MFSSETSPRLSGEAGRPYKVSLINMPFASLSLPSIALTQLRSVVGDLLGDRVRVRILYLNHDCAEYFGRDLYELVAETLEASNSGLGDWLFRQVAFPELADNSQLYFQRYFPALDEAGEVLRGRALARRLGLERFLDRLLTRYRLDREDLVGFTSMFAQNVASFALARRLKEKRPGIVTVMGGANCEAPMGLEIARHVDAVDFVFSGPALVSFPQLLGSLLAGDGDGAHRIRGVFSQHNADSEHLQGIGAIGAERAIEAPVTLDYDDFLDQLEHRYPDGEIDPGLPFETSRGCWWGERAHCTFCGLNGSTMAYRSLPPQRALELLEGLFRRYGDRCRRFESVDNIMPREYLESLFPHLRPPAGAHLFYEVKADLKDRELEVLSRAGVTRLQPGIEALATSTLRLMRKGTTSFQNLGFLKGCVRYRIEPAWNLLIGFPGEDAAVYRKYLEDLPRLTHLPPPSGAFPVRFDRFSPYFTRAAEYGLDLAPFAFYRAIYPFSDETLASLAYYFEDRNYDAPYLTNLAGWQRRLAAAVERWKKRWAGTDGGLRAELVAAPGDGGTVVRDTRSGRLVEHRTGDLGTALLDQLHRRAATPAAAARRLAADEAQVAAEIARLSSLELLFEEDGRYLSLMV